MEHDRKFIWRYLNVSKRCEKYRAPRGRLHLSLYAPFLVNMRYRRRGHVLPDHWFDKNTNGRLKLVVCQLYLQSDDLFRRIFLHNRGNNMFNLSFRNPPPTEMNLNRDHHPPDYNYVDNPPPMEKNIVGVPPLLGKFYWNSP